MEDSLIFSRQWKKEDILKIINFPNNQDLSLNKENDIYDDEEDESKINFDDYKDLMNEISSVFNQKDMESLNNDIQLILEYFYLREIIVEQSIINKYKNNDNQRHLNLRLADYAIRIQFEENISIKGSSKLINQFISEINETYVEKKNLNDLSDKTYMDNIEKVLGTKNVPKFLLREGFRIRRKLDKNRDYINNSIIYENINKYDIDDNSTNYSDNNNDINSIKQNKNIEIKSKCSNINKIINEIENNEILPFTRNLNEIYVIIFFLAIKEMNIPNLYFIIKNNLNKFIDYFKLDAYKNYNLFKQKFIDFNKNELPLEIIEMELSDINKSEYLCQFILASYYVLISQIFNNKNEIYINLLLFLQNYISKENILFENIIQNEINSLLLNEQNTNLNNKNINININTFNNKNKYNNNYNCYEKIIFQNEQKYHNTKILDLNSTINIFKNINDNKLKDRFFEIIKDEEVYEIGSNLLKNNIINFFKKKFKIQISENKDTIKRHLKLIRYAGGQYEEKTILILISGYFSSEDDHPKEWNNFVKVYEKKFNNPIIYFYNWPSSKMNLKKIIFHRKDFRDARERAKFCGQLLATMIMCEEIFDGFKINICAFSLGNHVLKHCIKELEKFEKLNLINNIIFMAGATNINCNEKWGLRLGSVNGIIANFYSDYDLALWYCRNITNKDTIGSKKLKIPKLNIKNYLISSFHILYRFNMEELGKMVIDDLKE